MNLFDNTSQFGIISKTFHWIIGILMIGLWTVGLGLAEHYIEGAQRPEMMTNHKSLGAIVLGLVILRIIWRFMNCKTSPRDDHFPKFSRVLYKLNNYLFYGLMLAFPLSGILMGLFWGKPLTIFGFQLMNGFTHEMQSVEVAKFLRGVHGVCGKLFIVAFAAHILGMLYHQFFLKDKILKRMI